MSAQTAENIAPGTLLNRKDAAKYVRDKWGRPCSLGLLNKKACEGGGPAFRKIGGRWVVYEKSELDRWATADISPPIASATEAAVKGISAPCRGGRRFNPF